MIRKWFMIPAWSVVLLMIDRPLPAEIFSMDLSTLPAARNSDRIVLGNATHPDGRTWTTDGISFFRNGKPLVPVMGEIHYSRYPRSEWRDALQKMKAGGITIVASYVFWIHHEETEGRFDWTDQRDLRAFVKLCGELDLPVVVRCGPWCHGEVRNGGLPEWLLDKKLKFRTDDPRYLAEVQRLYAETSKQLHGLLWKDGGPVIGIQIENEYHGPAQHLLTLKKMAVDAALDVPFYTRTGWPQLTTPMPFGELLPLYGAYAEGFWDRALTTMPGHYWADFVFKRVRTDASVATDHFGTREAKDEDGVDRYPYLTCEIGAGMMCSYHRRINVFEMDCLATPIVKLGSGSNMPGYYMYHGGTNPTGIDPHLQEKQASRFTNHNDLPVKSYDFQTAIGEFGQIRPQYHLLRRLHLFLQDFGGRLAPMAAVFPEDRIVKDDSDTLRYGIRTDGNSGFVFVNNYQRLLAMPEKKNVQWQLKTKTGPLSLPRTPTSIPADSVFFWPFNMELAGVTLTYATAQPVCEIEDDLTRYTVFATTGEMSEFVFETPDQSRTFKTSGQVSTENGRTIVRGVRAGTGAAIEIAMNDGRRQVIVLLDRETSLQCYKGSFAGRERLILGRQGVIIESEAITVTTTNDGPASVAILPAVKRLAVDGKIVAATSDGVFQRFEWAMQELKPLTLTCEAIKPAGTLREVALGAAKVAEAPSEADFEQAAVWKVKLPERVDPDRRLILRFTYAGDVARAYLGDRLLTDHFYNGTPFDVGVNRFGKAIYEGGLTLKILPLQKDAPIYMLDRSRPDFGGESSIAQLIRAEVVEERRIRFAAE